MLSTFFSLQLYFSRFAFAAPIFRVMLPRFSFTPLPRERQRRQLHFLQPQQLRYLPITVFIVPVRFSPLMPLDFRYTACRDTPPLPPSFRCHDTSSPLMISHAISLI